MCWFDLRISSVQHSNGCIVHKAIGVCMFVHVRVVCLGIVAHLNALFHLSAIHNGGELVRTSS